MKEILIFSLVLNGSSSYGQVSEIYHHKSKVYTWSIYGGINHQNWNKILGLEITPFYNMNEQINVYSLSVSYNL